MHSRYGLVKKDVSGSLSPLMYNAAFRKFGMDASYGIIAVDSLQELKGEIPSLEGFNVTMPYKETVVGLLDGIEKTAEEIGAVNLVAREAGKLVGYNTDWSAALESLRSKVEIEDARIAVIGAGGAARAVVYGLKDFSQVTVFNRTEERAREMARYFGCGHGSLGAMGGKWDAIINCTPVNDGSLVPESTLRGALVFDLLYRQTELLKAARRLGSPAMDGLEMLARQASLAFWLWTGKSVDHGFMMEATGRV